MAASGGGHRESAYDKPDCSGTINDAARTTNFDRVARDGALFRRAFVSAASYIPAAASSFGAIIPGRPVAGQLYAKRFGVGRLFETPSLAKTTDEPCHVNL
jgi:hypothetical protein